MANSPKKRDRLTAAERRARGLVAPEDLPYTAIAGEVSLDENTWSELETRIKLSLGSDTRADLTRALNDLLMNFELRKETPPGARKVNQDLKRIDKYSKGLAELIGQHPRYAAQIAVDPLVGYDTSKLEAILRQISTAARGSAFFKRSGHPPRNVERAFAERVKKVWQAAAKTEKHGAHSNNYPERGPKVKGPVGEIVTTLLKAARDAVQPLRDENAGDFVTATEKLYLSRDGSRLVAKTDPDVGSLYAIVGQLIPEAEARRLGLVTPEGKEPQPTEKKESQPWDSLPAILEALKPRRKKA